MHDSSCNSASHATRLDTSLDLMATSEPDPPLLFMVSVIDHKLTTSAAFAACSVLLWTFIGTSCPQKKEQMRNVYDNALLNKIWTLQLMIRVPFYIAGLESHCIEQADSAAQQVDNEKMNSASKVEVQL